MEYRREFAVIFILCTSVVLVLLIWTPYGQLIFTQDSSSKSNINAVPLPHKPRDDNNATTPPLVYFTIKSCGGFGNELLQYAALYAFSRQFLWWTACVIPGNYSRIRQAFYNLTIINRDLRCPETQTLPTSINQEVTLRTLSKHTLQNLTLNGFFQSHKYFDWVERDLRQELVFSDSLRRRVEQFFTEVQPPSWANISYARVGIHVRRTDQLSEKRVQMGNIEHPASYFRHAMAHFKQHYSRVQFIVASDDLAWCREHLTAENVVFSAKKSILDFAVVASCDDVIVSLGSYSWWIGYLCTGTTVYYGVSPKHGTYMAKIRANDSWIPAPDSPYNKWIAIV